MNRKAFGQLVTVLRKELLNEHDRRLTQAELAEKVQQRNTQTWLNEVLLGKIERGERAKLEVQTILELADALELTLGERREFVLLANGLNDEALYPSPLEAEAILSPLLETAQMAQLPVFVVDTYLDVVAVNGPLLSLYHGTLLDLTSTSGNEFNLLKFIFSPIFQTQRDMMPVGDWSEFAYRNILYFRMRTLPYRATPYFQHLLAQLRQFPLFRHYWQREVFDKKSHFVGGNSIQLKSPKWGHLHYFTCLNSTLTPYGALDFVTYIPASPETMQAFLQISQQIPATVYQLASWPQKTVG